MENFSHANIRLHFGPLGDHLVVGPRNHRWHHALDLPADPRLSRGCNFAILFPAWDILFGTRYLAPALPATGIHETSEREIGARDGFWAQQRLGLVLLWQALAAKGRQAALSVRHTPYRPGRASSAPSAGPCPGRPGEAGGR